MLSIVLTSKHIPSLHRTWLQGWASQRRETRYNRLSIVRYDAVSRRTKTASSVWCMVYGVGTYRSPACYLSVEEEGAGEEAGEGEGEEEGE